MAQKIVGFDVRDSNVKVVEVLKTLRKASVLSATIVDNIGTYARQNDNLSNILQMPFPQESVTSRMIHFPFSSSRKLEQTTPFELESWVPDPGDDFISDYQVVTKEKNSSLVLVAGTKKENIANWIARFEADGVPIRSAMPEGFVYRSLARFMGVSPERTIAFLDIGKTQVILSVTKGDRAAAARAFQRNSEAEGNSLEVDFGNLATDVDNMLRYIGSEEGIEPEKIFLCGDMAATPGLDEYLSGQLGHDVEVWSSPPDTGVRVGPEYALALAIALEQSHPAKGINLRKGEFIYRTEGEEVSERLITPAMLIAAFIVLLIVGVLFQNRTLEVKAATLDATTTAMISKLLPGTKVDPSKSLEILKEEMSRAGKLGEAIGRTDYLTPLQAITAISKHLPEDLDVDIDEISLTEKTLTIGGTITEYSQMDTIQKSLEEFEGFKRFDPPKLREKVGKQEGVKFTLKIYLTEEEEEL